MEYKVYFIQQGESGAIKIGMSKNVESRIVELQVANPEKLRVLCCISCTSATHAFGLEKQLHRKFRNFRIRGEWFRASIIEQMPLLREGYEAVPNDLKDERVMFVESLLVDLLDAGTGAEKDIVKALDMLECIG